ncbi:hypothetical protein JTB14_004126 [Gonioctena quinquepunctata]|nr:hypothetical protein JTB14_004126 [Gonioctena quinquepunctata]
MSRSSTRFDTKKVNSELVTLTYGALVAQMIKDLDNTDDVSKHLERLGYNMGIRLIEDFLAKTGSGRCFDLKETADKIQTAFKMYLGVQPNVTNWSSSGDEFSFMLDVNPLTELVELPDDLKGLKYCNIICGVIRGALEMVQLDVQSWIVQICMKLVENRHWSDNRRNHPTTFGVKTAIKCIKCEAVAHPSCANKLKNVTICEEGMICCHEIEMGSDTSFNLNLNINQIKKMDDADLNIANTEEIEITEENMLKKEIYLKIIVRHKDFIIRQLQEKIQLIQEVKFQQQEKNVNKPFLPAAYPPCEPLVIQCKESDLDSESSVGKLGVSKRPSPSKPRKQNNKNGTEKEDLNNYQHNEEQKQQIITTKQLNAAILEAKTSTTMMSLQQANSTELIELEGQYRFAGMSPTVPHAKKNETLAIVRETLANIGNISTATSEVNHREFIPIPKIIILCDEIGYGLRKSMSKFIGEEFTIETIIKPGAYFVTVIEDVVELSMKFGLNDYIIVIAGSNDFKSKKYPSFREINSRIKECSHMNIIFSSVPYGKQVKLNDFIYKFNVKLNEYTYKLNHYAEGDISFFLFELYERHDAK